MANALQKLIKNSNASSLSRILLSSSNLQQIPFLLPKPAASKPGTPEPSSLAPRIDESSKLSRTRQPVFPSSSPFGFCLNPVPVSGVRILEGAVGDGDGDGVIRADSVKKKRKKKMNKHKLKKLRKRLRRKAK